MLTKEPTQPAVSIEAVIGAVAGYFGVRISDLRGRARRAKVSGARQIAMYLAHELTGLSAEEIGLRFDWRSRDAVNYSIGVVRIMLRPASPDRERLSLALSLLRQNLSLTSSPVTGFRLDQPGGSAASDNCATAPAAPVTEKAAPAIARVTSLKSFPLLPLARRKTHFCGPQLTGLTTTTNRILVRAAVHVSVNSAEER